MVGVPSGIAAPPNRQRMLSIMRDVDFPGGHDDHMWMARRLEAFSCKLNQGSPSAFLEDLLLCGLLMERGFDISDSPQLAGRCFPDRWLRAVPRLLTSGCPESSWRFIEKGVIRFEGKGAGKGNSSRWCIDGKLLEPLFLEWHELGACLIFQNLALALQPLMQEPPESAEITITGTNRHTGRQWLRELKSALRALGTDPSLHRLVIG
ncbi:MAG: hypothetical protein WD708_01870 [Kiritimatiellia bacterium]